MTDQVHEQVGDVHAETGLDPRSEGEAQALVAPDSNEATDTSELQEQLAAAQREIAASNDKFLRARADMENYKKRIERNYADMASSLKKDLLRKILGVKDNLERALQFGENSESSGESIIEGVRLTQYQLDQLLQQEGVFAIEAEGQPFDPQFEEAIQSVHDPNMPDHSVVQVVRAGYKYGDNVLRPAQVIVNVHSQE